MRKPLSDLIQKTIVYKFDLPNLQSKLSNVCISTQNDKCYEILDNQEISTIIYNLIIEYSFNEFEIEQNNYDNLLAEALLTRIKYNFDVDEKVKLKYGFFGEVLLHAILKLYFATDILIARGYFYDPLQRTETKGFDSYHLIEAKGQVELWFGEVKFHQNFSNGINSALNNIEEIITDKYFNRNVFSLSNHISDFNYSGSLIEKIILKWKKDPSINIAKEMAADNIKLVYPILIIYDLDSNSYESNIAKAIKYILDKHSVKKFDLSIDLSLFFIFIPLKKTLEIKRQVIKWIEEKKPVTL